MKNLVSILDSIDDLILKTKTVNPGKHKHEGFLGANGKPMWHDVNIKHKTGSTAQTAHDNEVKGQQAQFQGEPPQEAQKQPEVQQPQAPKISWPEHAQALKEGKISVDGVISTLGGLSEANGKQYLKQFGLENEDLIWNTYYKQGIGPMYSALKTELTKKYFPEQFKQTQEPSTELPEGYDKHPEQYKAGKITPEKIAENAGNLLEDEFYQYIESFGMPHKKAQYIWDNPSSYEENIIDWFNPQKGKPKSNIADYPENIHMAAYREGKFSADDIAEYASDLQHQQLFEYLQSFGMPADDIKELHQIASVPDFKQKIANWIEGKGKQIPESKPQELSDEDIIEDFNHFIHMNNYDEKKAFEYVNSKYGINLDQNTFENKIWNNPPGAEDGQWKKNLLNFIHQEKKEEIKTGKAKPKQSFDDYSKMMELTSGKYNESELANYVSEYFNVDQSVIEPLINHAKAYGGIFWWSNFINELKKTFPDHSGWGVQPGTVTAEQAIDKFKTIVGKKDEIYAYAESIGISHDELDKINKNEKGWQEGVKVWFNKKNKVKGANKLKPGEVAIKIQNFNGVDFATLSDSDKAMIKEFLKNENKKGNNTAKTKTEKTFNFHYDEAWHSLADEVYKELKSEGWQYWQLNKKKDAKPAKNYVKYKGPEPKAPKKPDDDIEPENYDFNAKYDDMTDGQKYKFLTEGWNIDPKYAKEWIKNKLSETNLHGLGGFLDKLYKKDYAQGEPQKETQYLEIKDFGGANYEQLSDQDKALIKEFLKNEKKKGNGSGVLATKQTYNITGNIVPLLDEVNEELVEEGFDLSATYTDSSKQTKYTPFAEKLPEVKIGKVEDIIKPFETKDWDKELTQVSGKKGTTEGGLYKDSTGKQYYVKFPGKERAEIENLAAKLYQLAGVNVANTSIIPFQGKDAISSEWLDDVKSINAEEMIKAGAGDDFVIDAWLANWDVVGADFDNMVLVGGKEKGGLYRIAPGGSIYFRAQGEKKDFTNEVPELKNMMNPSVGKQSGQVFKGITEEQAKKGIAKLQKMSMDDVYKVVDSTGLSQSTKDDLKSKLLARKDYIIKNWKQDMFPPKATPSAPKPEKPKEIKKTTIQLKSNPVEQILSTHPDEEIQKIHQEMAGKVFEIMKSKNDIYSVNDFLRNLMPESDTLADLCIDWQSGHHYGQIEVRSAIGVLKGNSQQQFLNDSQYYMYEKGINASEFNNYYKKGVKNAKGLIPFVIASREALKQKFPSGKVRVWRGLSGNSNIEKLKQSYKKSNSINDQFAMPDDGAPGYSFEYSIAKDFAGSSGIVVTKEVPIDRIWIYFNSFSTSFTHEEEVIIDPDAVALFDMDEIEVTGYSNIVHKSFVNPDTIYDQMESLLAEHSIEKMAHLVESKQQLPIGAKSLAEKIEYNTYSSLRDIVNNWFGDVEKDSNPQEILLELKKDLLNWQQDVVSSQMNDFQQLFSKGLEAGIKQTGIPIDEKYLGDVNFMVLRKTGIAPAIENFGNQVFEKLSGIVMKHHNDKIGIPLYRTKRDIDSELNRDRYKTRLMLKTEVAKIANEGVIRAWEKDPDKDMYEYHWENPNDKRSKKISIIRKQGNPYSFAEISFLWKNQEQLINNSWQSDVFNQRCSISRGNSIDKEWLDNRFLGRESEFKSTS